MALLYTLLPQLGSGTKAWAWFPTLTLAPVNAETALSVAWTLKHEILFYAIFGFGYFSGRLKTVLVIWFGAICMSLLAHLPANVPLAPINLEFFMGIAIAMMARRGWPFRIRSPDWDNCGNWLLLGSRTTDHAAEMGSAIANLFNLMDRSPAFTGFGIKTARWPGPTRCFKAEIPLARLL